MKFKELPYTVELGYNNIGYNIQIHGSNELKKNTITWFQMPSSFKT